MPDEVPPVQPIRPARRLGRVQEPQGKRGWRLWMGQITRDQLQGPRRRLPQSTEPEADGAARRALEDQVTGEGKFLDLDA